MAIEQLIKQGEEQLDKKEFEAAIQSFTSALVENPTAYKALISRSIVYQRSKQYDLALIDIEKALTVSELKGNRENIGYAVFRRGLVQFAVKKYPEALADFEKAHALNVKDNTLPIWKLKAQTKVKELNGGEEPAKQEEKVRSPPSTAKSTDIDTINKLAPLKIKIREDWYQSSNAVTITIFAKNIDKEKANIHFNNNSLSITFPTTDNSEYNYNLDPLFDEIDPEKSSYKIMSTKLEIVLSKKRSVKWSTLERSADSIVPQVDSATETKEITSAVPAALAYPSSSKNKINWNNFKLDDEDEEPEKDDFFQSVFKNADTDTQRAMMKSYTESNGTALSTNWDDVKAKTFETSPPDGMVAKKW